MKPVKAIVALAVTGFMLGSVLPRPVIAGGVNLSWTECGNGGELNRAFACNVNTGSNRLVASFDPVADMPDLEVLWLTVELQSADATTLNNWWTMYNPGSCRGEFVPNVNAIFATAGCVDVFLGSGVTGIASYTIAGNRAELRAVHGVPDPRSVTAGTEYYAMNIVINNTRTVGVGACSGCLTAACLTLRSVVLENDVTFPSTVTQSITHPRDRNFVTWQGGAIPGGCPAATPARTRTWGRIKSLYR